ncbi:MAG: hypothetical protein U0P45_11915 [Acidimicrobiales bacterium]
MTAVLPVVAARTLGASQAVLDLHAAWAWVVIVTNGLVGAWALAAHRWPQLRHRALWWCTIAAEVAIFVQVILGVILIQGKDKDAYGMHLLYGFSAAFAVGILYSYRNQLKGKEYLLYGCGGLFVMGLGLRAINVLP